MGLECSEQAGRQANAAGVPDALDRHEAGVIVCRDGVMVVRPEDYEESEIRFRAMADAAPILIWVSGEDQRRSWVNQRMLAFTGRDLESECGYGWAEGLHADDRQRCLAAYRDAFDRREPFEIEYRLKNADGEYRWLIDHGVPHYSAAGQFLGYVGSCVDNTTRKRAREQLSEARDAAERANNAKSRFLAAASHDLRQPLAALALYVGMLKAKIGSSDRALVDNIKGCVESLSELLTDLLDVSKLDAGVVKPEIGDFAIADVLDKLVAQHSTEAQIKGLELRHRRSPLMVRSDPLLLGRMLGNMIANAVHYTERGGVLVGCRRSQGRMWVEIWDTGIGIPEEMTSVIFEEYRQLANASRSSGSGLGLAIVAKMAELLGLRIRVRSRPGKGSLFAVELPPGQSSDARAPAAEANGAPRTRTIALVEDNPLVLDALVYTLEAAGHRVVGATSCAELIERLAARAPDLIISDYRLSGRENGLDVIAAARTVFGAGLPAIILTGDTDPSILGDMAGRGIAILHKPIDDQALNRCIAQATRGGTA